MRFRSEPWCLVEAVGIHPQGGMKRTMIRRWHHDLRKWQRAVGTHGILRGRRIRIGMSRWIRRGRHVERRWLHCAGWLLWKHLGLKGRGIAQEHSPSRTVDARGMGGGVVTVAAAAFGTAGRGGRETLTVEFEASVFAKLSELQQPIQ